MRYSLAAGESFSVFPQGFAILFRSLGELPTSIMTSEQMSSSWWCGRFYLILELILFIWLLRLLNWLVIFLPGTKLDPFWISCFFIELLPMHWSFEKDFFFKLLGLFDIRMFLFLFEEVDRWVTVFISLESSLSPKGWILFLLSFRGKLMLKLKTFPWCSKLVSFFSSGLGALPIISLQDASKALLTISWTHSYSSFPYYFYFYLSDVFLEMSACSSSFSEMGESRS